MHSRIVVSKQMSLKENGTWATHTTLCIRGLPRVGGCPLPIPSWIDCRRGTWTPAAPPSSLTESLDYRISGIHHTNSSPAHLSISSLRTPRSGISDGPLVAVGTLTPQTVPRLSHLSTHTHTHTHMFTDIHIRLIGGVLGTEKRSPLLFIGGFARHFIHVPCTSVPS